VDGLTLGNRSALAASLLAAALVAWVVAVVRIRDRYDGSETVTA
jgi:hypothetical protein